MNGEINEFNYSKEYIDYLFGGDIDYSLTEEERQVKQQQRRKNLDSLLAQQKWRKNIIGDSAE